MTSKGKRKYIDKYIRQKDFTTCYNTTIKHHLYNYRTKIKTDFESYLTLANVVAVGQTTI